MSNQNSNDEPLAHWRFTEEQWREFLYYENIEFESRALVDLRSVLMFAIGVVFIIAVLGGAKGGAAAFLFILAAGALFLGFSIAIHRLVRWSSKESMKSRPTGEVLIHSRFVNLNGAIYDWRGRWSLPQIDKSCIYVGGEKMLTLAFTTKSWVMIRGTREPIEKNFLVPVPFGKEAEADEVIRRIKENSW